MLIRPKLFKSRANLSISALKAVTCITTDLFVLSRIIGLYFLQIFFTFSTFFELFGNSSSNSSNLNFDSGLTYLIDDDSQFDITIGKGLNNDLFFVNLGFSFRIY